MEFSNDRPMLLMLLLLLCCAGSRGGRTQMTTEFPPMLQKRWKFGSELLHVCVITMIIKMIQHIS